jgi:CRP-like cAMP-binding protein/Fe-S-cluster-containing hydrogenase component 2
LNLQPAVLETAALPIELLASAVVDSTTGYVFLQPEILSIAPRRAGAGARMLYFLVETMLQPIDLHASDEDQAVAPRWRPDDVATSAEALGQLDGLANLPVAERRLIAPLVSLRAYPPGVAVTSEHDIGHAFFVVFHGSIVLSRADMHGTPVVLGVLGRGDIFGEGGLFGSRYRRMTARADTHVVLLRIPYDELLPLWTRLPTLTTQLQHSHQERLLQTTLARVPMFTGLSAIERLTIATELEESHIDRGGRAKVMSVAAGQRVQPTDEQALHIIAEGQATVVRDGHPVGVLSPGDFFGEMELLHLNNTLADIVALTPLHVLSLPASTCAQLFEEHPSVLEDMLAIARERMEDGTKSARIDFTESAIRSGIVRGRKVLARIPDMCPPGCRLCERACADRFSVSRLRLDGTTFGRFDVPTTCMHCTWSPECVEACPTDAIRLGNDGFLFVNNQCIGCEECAKACPYDAITMIPLYPPAKNPMERVLRRVRRPEPVRLDANKCDGCHDFADQACLSICPTGSLRWVSADDLAPSI